MRFIIFDKYLKYILWSFGSFELLYRLIMHKWFLLAYIEFIFYYIGEFFNLYICTFSLTGYKFILIVIVYIRLNLKVNKYIDLGPEFGGPLEEYFKTQVWKTHQTKAEFQADTLKKETQAATEEAAEYTFTADTATSKE